MKVKSFTVSSIESIGPELEKLMVTKSNVISIETTRELYYKVFYWS